jgi:hypothetical protein
MSSLKDGLSLKLTYRTRVLTLLSRSFGHLGALRPLQITPPALVSLGDFPPGPLGTESERCCSVCARPLGELPPHRVWISLPVATDVLPLLVNACSEECIPSLPTPPEGYVQEPHRGGLEVEQPDASNRGPMAGRR